MISVYFSVIGNSRQAFTGMAYDTLQESSRLWGYRSRRCSPKRCPARRQGRYSFALAGWPLTLLLLEAHQNGIEKALTIARGGFHLLRIDPHENPGGVFRFVVRALPCISSRLLQAG